MVGAVFEEGLHAVEVGGFFGKEGCLGAEGEGEAGDFLLESDIARGVPFCDGSVGGDGGSGVSGGVLGEEGLISLLCLVSLLSDLLEVFAMIYFSHSFSPFGRRELEFCLVCNA